MLRLIYLGAPLLRGVSWRGFVGRWEFDYCWHVGCGIVCPFVEDMWFCIYPGFDRGPPYGVLLVVMESCGVD